MEWFRMYHDITRDHKLRRHPSAVKWIWISLLCIANQSPIRGYLLLSRNVSVTLQDVTDESGEDLATVEKAMAIFKSQDMLEEVDGVLHIKNWDKRQFISDDVSERVRNYRGKSQPLKRFRNVTETVPDPDTDLNNKKEDPMKKVIHSFENNIHPLSPIELEKLNDWAKDFDPPVIVRAIEEAVKNNARKLSYIQAVLRDWLIRKLTTITALDAYMRDQEDKKRSGIQKKIAPEAAPKKPATKKDINDEFYEHMRKAKEQESNNE
jgi:DnaD/phage-associated family protein